MSKMYAMNQETFNTLPEEVKTHIKNTLKAFDEVTVSYEYGRYEYGLCLKGKYADDFKFIGTAYADDFYNLDERMQNYEEEFGCRHVGRWNTEWADKQRELEVGKVFIQ